MLRPDVTHIKLVYPRTLNMFALSLCLSSVSCRRLSPLSSLYSKRLWTAPTIRFSFAGHWTRSSPGRLDPLLCSDWLCRPRLAPDWWKFAQPGRCRAAAELAAHRIRDWRQLNSLREIDNYYRQQIINFLDSLNVSDVSDGNIAVYICAKFHRTWRVRIFQGCACALVKWKDRRKSEEEQATVFQRHVPHCYANKFPERTIGLCFKSRNCKQVVCKTFMTSFWRI